MNDDAKTFLQRLFTFLERELENPPDLSRVPEGRFAPGHEPIRELLQRLGYGGRRLYVPKKKDDLTREIEAVIESDAARGINIFSRYYSSLLKEKLKSLGVKADVRKVEAVLYKVRGRKKQEKPLFDKKL
jgi:hypothetical protein